MLFIPSEGLNRALEKGVYLEIFDRNRIILVQVDKADPSARFIYQTSPNLKEYQMIAMPSRREPIPSSRYRQAPASPPDPTLPPGIFPGPLIELPPPNLYEPRPPKEYNSPPPLQPSSIKPNIPTPPATKQKSASSPTKSKDQGRLLPHPSSPNIPLTWIIPSIFFGMIGGYLLRKFLFRPHPIFPVLFLRQDIGSQRVESLMPILSSVEIRLKPMIDPGKQNILSFDSITMDEGEK